ncbi:phage tail assembly protein [Novispirillum itersonii]|uniref:phage tail assembly protein n=1 Tax=Novispirillum itersonii TaxID=189 RepID=UPI0003802596|nr:phage tail assembly protein [Novispirillum itersonii]
MCVIELENPITIGNKTIEKLELREPVLKDLYGLDLSASENQLEHTVKLIARLAGHSDVVFSNLPLGQAKEIIAKSSDFLSSALS